MPRPLPVEVTRHLFRIQPIRVERSFQRHRGGSYTTRSVRSTIEYGGGGTRGGNHAFCGLSSDLLPAPDLRAVAPFLSWRWRVGVFFSMGFLMWLSC